MGERKPSAPLSLPKFVTAAAVERTLVSAPVAELITADIAVEWSRLRCAGAGAAGGGCWRARGERKDAGFGGLLQKSVEDNYECTARPIPEAPAI